MPRKKKRREKPSKTEQEGTPTKATSKAGEMESSRSEASQPENPPSTHASPPQGTSEPSQAFWPSTGGPSVARSFSFFLLLAIIVLIGLLSYRVLQSFILPLFLAALLVVIFRPFHEWVLRHCGEYHSLAAGLTTASILIIALGPGAWMIAAGVREGIDLTHRDWTEDYDKLSAAREKLGLKMPYRKELDEIQTQLNKLELSDNASDMDVSFAQKSRLLSVVEEKLNGFEKTLNGLPENSEVSDSFLSRVEKATPRLADMDDTLAKLKSLVNAKSEKDPSTEFLAPAKMNTYQELVDQNTYQELVDQMNDHYTSARQDLMGGVVWAPLVELADPSEERIDQWQAYSAEKLRSWMLKLTGQAGGLMGGLLMQLFILTVAIFYFLIDGPQLIASAMQLSPMDDKHEAEIIAEFSKLSRAVVVATLLSAIVQGVLAGAGYFCVWGFDSLFMLIILTTILAMIPFVGAAAVWVPACIYLAFIEDRVPAAIGLAVYGTLIVSMADNVIKPMVLKGQSNLHPLFALLSVLGGVQALGPIGVLVGPMVVAFLQSLLKILHKEMQQLDQGAVARS